MTRIKYLRSYTNKYPWEYGFKREFVPRGTPPPFPTRPRKLPA